MTAAAHDSELARLAPLGDAVRATRVDGVPVVHARRAGVMTASLGFRVGARDEPLHLRGITHVVEHLALHRFDALAQHRNGRVNGVSTEFVVAGREEHVVDFLNGVCAALRDLPLHRLDVEKTVLRTEAQSRSAVADLPLAHARYGSGGPARERVEEFALDRLDADDVTAWVAEWFVAENAVLWISTDDLPAGLDLRLRSGRRRPLEPVAPLDRPRPLSVPGPPRLVMADALVPRSTAALLAAELMRVVLFRELRLEGGLSYTAHAEYEPVDADRARLVVLADAIDENQGAVTGAVVDALAALRAGRIEERDLTAARDAALDRLESQREPGVGAMLAAHLLLFGDEILTVDQYVDEVAAVTDDELVAVIRAFWGDAIWMSPDGALDWIGATAVSYAADAVDGREFAYLGAPERLVVGPDGVSWVAPDRTLTVRADACEALVVAGDGGRMLIGADGVSIVVEPTLLERFGDAELAEIDALVPEKLRLPAPARPPEQLPVPPAVPSRRGFGAWALSVAIALLLLGLPTLAGAVDAAERVGELDDSGDVVGAASAVRLGALALVFLGSAAIFATGWFHRIRSRR